MCHSFDATMATSLTARSLSVPADSGGNGNACWTSVIRAASLLALTDQRGSTYESIIPVPQTHVCITAWLVLAHVLARLLLRLEQTVRDTVTQIIQAQDAI